MVVQLRLGSHSYDITTRALVMGILNRTPDSFYDSGGYWDFDDFLAKAEQLVADGADFLDVGGVKAAPGEEVGEQEELDRVVPAVEALVQKFDLPVSVDTWRAAVARTCYDAGAVVGKRHLGLCRSRLSPRGGRSRGVGGRLSREAGASCGRSRAPL